LNSLECVVVIVWDPKLCKVIIFSWQTNTSKIFSEGRKAIDFLVWWSIAKILGSKTKEGLLPSHFKKNIVRIDRDLCFYRRLEDSKTWRQKDWRLVCCGF